jgi:putative endonuclease
MPREYRFFVYILASLSRRIYCGVTNNVERRVAQHKAGEIKGFTQQYKINRLVYYEQFQFVEEAIRREKAIKHWVRARRVALIERDNPTWDDLSEDWGKPIEVLKPMVAPAKSRSPAPGARGMTNKRA